jgi:hypothetical protein
MPGWVLDRVSNLHERELFIILNLLQKLDGHAYDGLAIIKELIKLNYLEEPAVEPGKTREEVLNKRWGSYVGIINAYGLANYSSGTIELSPISKALLNKEITYSEFVKIQMSKWQLPNSALQSKTINEYTSIGICLKPFIATLKVYCELLKISPNAAWLDLYDIVNHLITLKSHGDADIKNAVDNIVNDRASGVNRATKKIGAEDIVFNTFCETGYLKKYSKIVDTIGGNQRSISSPYVLTTEYLPEIEECIQNSEVLLDPSPNSANKEDWLRKYGDWKGGSFLKNNSETKNKVEEIKFSSYVRNLGEIKQDQFIINEPDASYNVQDEIFSFDQELGAVTHQLKVVAVAEEKVCVRVLNKFNPPITPETIIKDERIGVDLKKWIDDSLTIGEKLIDKEPDSQIDKIDASQISEVKPTQESEIGKEQENFERK